MQERATERLDEARLASPQDQESSIPIPISDEVFPSIVGTCSWYDQGMGSGAKPPSRSTRQVC